MPFRLLPATLAAASLLAATGLLAASGPGQAANDPLAAARWTHRVLLIYAPRADDPLLRRQRTAFEAMRPGAHERDLVLVEAVGDTPQADALRRRFDLDPSTFQVVLVGKDGGAKLRSAGVLGQDQLFPTIDAMPMRQQEMQRAAAPPGQERD